MQGSDGEGEGVPSSSHKAEGCGQEHGPGRKHNELPGELRGKNFTPQDHAVSLIRYMNQWTYLRF